MFDPEKVGRYDLDRSYGCGNAIMEMCERGDYVNSSDYDQLLALYRKQAFEIEMLESWKCNATHALNLDILEYRESLKQQ